MQTSTLKILLLNYYSKIIALLVYGAYTAMSSLLAVSKKAYVRIMYVSNCKSLLELNLIIFIRRVEQNIYLMLRIDQQSVNQISFNNVTKPASI